MNKTNNGSRYGMTQYCSPRDLEFAGKTLTLTGEGGPVTLTFHDEKFLTCAAGGEELYSSYEALKAADGAHLVFFGTKDLKVAVIDEVNASAALSLGEPGSYIFLKIEGAAAAGAETPGFTDEMTDTHIRWIPAFEKYLELRFTAPDACEISFSPRKDRPRAAQAACIRIREGLYLTEVNRTSPMWSDMPQGYSRIVLLQDYKRLLFAGGIYSPVLNDLKLLSGYGADPEPEN
ncbi:MAG: hypothetical protein IIY83_05935 [Lachnospiraceae bacterium]|nr:hypothetical protein [Lachnospiraceae bacterium]